MRTKTLRRVSKVNVRSARNKDIKHMNEDPRSLQHKISMGIAITIRILGIERVNPDPNLTRHLTRKIMHPRKVILMIWIEVQCIGVIIVKKMETFMRIAYKHISKLTIRDG